jgi:ABC-type Zn uptake system ZnuABC Zn-binding protein ZnuA
MGRLAYVFLPLILVLAGCGGMNAGSSRSGQITVVATTTQMQDMVRNVGGRHVHVVGILEPNVDPHDFEPTPSTAVALADSALVVESGAGIDHWADDLVQSTAPDTPVFVASEGLPLRPGDEADHEEDPHWWHDPTLYERVVVSLADRLAETDPGNAAGYRRNAERYAAAVREMDAENMRLLERVPPAERKLVTNHDAFGYLASHYDITIVGSVIPSLSSAAEPSAGDVAELIERIRSEGVRAIFTESSINPALEERIARDAGVEVYANLYSDTLGPEGSPGATYLDMERWNIEALVAGFTGSAPPQID